MSTSVYRSLYSHAWYSWTTSALELGPELGIPSHYVLDVHVHFVWLVGFCGKASLKRNVYIYLNTSATPSHPGAVHPSTWTGNVGDSADCNW